MFNSRSFSRRKSVALALAVTAALGIVAGGASVASAAGTASISGTVFGPDSVTPIANVQVSLDLPGGTYVQFGSTDASGNYTFTGLTAASYILDFAPNFGDNYAPQWWNNQPTMATATPIAVAAGAAVSGLQTTLAAGASVTGHVDAPGNAAIYIHLVDHAGNYIAYGFSNGPGDYSINGVPAGSYTAEFTDQNDPGIQPQWWNDEPSQATADYFTLTAGATSSGIDATLGGSSPAAASISGAVYAPGSPAVGAQSAQVTLLKPDGSQAAATSTGFDGTYSFSGIDAGSYTLEFTPSLLSPPSAPQWWQGEPSLAAADFFSVADGQVLTGFDAQLVEGGTISGTVLDGTAANAPMAGVYVSVYQNGVPVTEFNTPFTDDSGNYSLIDLAPGSYDVQFQAAYPSNDVSQWWQGAASEATATHVTVTGGTIASGINATLQAGGSISGVVSGRTPNGSVFAVPNSQLRVFTADGTLISDYVYAGDDGSYSITNLPAGSYKIYFVPQPDTTDFVPQWWKNKSTQATATTIVLKAGQTKSDINPILESTALKASTPKLSGKPRVGSTLTAKPGKWGPGTVSLTYSWARGGVAIAGATSSTYALTNEDANATITVTVTGSEPGYITDSVASANSKPVTGGSLSVGVPSIAGTPTHGQVLTASPGGWGPGTVDLTYKWYRGSSRIVGATASTYTLGHSDIGKRITVRVTGAEVGFTTAVAASAATSVVN